MNLPVEIKEMALQVPEKKQKEVQKVINDIFLGTEEWESKVDMIEVKDIHDIMSIQLADTARRNVKIARLNAEKIFDSKREELKVKMSDFKLEDGLWLKSKQIMQLQFKHIEEKAKYKADFVKRYESEQHEFKIEKRIIQMFPFNPEIERNEIELLTDETFDVLLNGLIKAQEEKQAAEIKAEKERIEKEKAEKERIANIEAENKRLEKEKIKAEKERKRLAEIQTKKDQEAEKERQRIAKIEAEKQAKIKKEMESKLAKEKAERQKIADELEAKRIKEIKAEQQKLKTEKAERLAPDKDKLLKLADDLFFFPIPDLKSREARNILKDVNVLLGKIKKHIEDKVKTL